VARAPLHQIPISARTAWLALREALGHILRGELVAMWAHGGTIGVGDPPHAGDLDTYVILSHQLEEATTRAIEDAHEAIASDHGVEWDAWCVLDDAARSADPPRHAWREGRRDTSWALHRAHWLAGRYVNLHGPEPAELVTAPTWDELESELDRELEHIERHVVEGDTDAYEATYALLNGSRILHSITTHNVAISKRAAGTWALEHLPARWHPALTAATRAYDGRPADGDAPLLAGRWLRSSRSSGSGCRLRRTGQLTRCPAGPAISRTSQSSDEVLKSRLVPSMGRVHGRPTRPVGGSRSASAHPAILKKDTPVARGGHADDGHREAAQDDPAG
jgi:hypothetical protein